MTTQHEQNQENEEIEGLSPTAPPTRSARTPLRPLVFIFISAILMAAGCRILVDATTFWGNVIGGLMIGFFAAVQFSCVRKLSSFTKKQT